MSKFLSSSDFTFNPSDLPTMPAVASELLRTSDLEEIDIRKLAESIRKDASLSARILQIVNSSFFGFSQRIGTISQALVALGIRATRSLVLSYSVLGLTPRGSTALFDYDSFWARSLNAATTAREIARAIGSKVDEEAFLAGLLQDIGMVVLAQKMPKHYAEIMERAEHERIPLVQMEREELGTDHAAVGAHVLEAWSFPDELVFPIFNHHDAVHVNLEPELRKMCSIQFVASGLGDWLYSTERREEQFVKVLAKTDLELGLSLDDLAGVLEQIDTAVEANATMFDVAMQRQESYTGLLNKANRVVEQLVKDQEFRIRKLETDVEDATKLSYQLRIANNELLNEARRDPLTGLANRRALEENLRREIARHARHKLPMGALFVDIDWFKAVNDSHGHEFGDLVLKTVATALTEAVRQEDLVARYGGEEFVVVVVNAGEAAVQLVAERVRGHVEKRGKNEARTLSITVSVGAAYCEVVEDSLQAEFLIGIADSAMYDAKKSGRNKVCFTHVTGDANG